MKKNRMNNFVKEKFIISLKKNKLLTSLRQYFKSNILKDFCYISILFMGLIFQFSTLYAAPNCRQSNPNDNVWGWDDSANASCRLSGNNQTSTGGASPAPTGTNSNCRQSNPNDNVWGWDDAANSSCRLSGNNQNSTGGESKTNLPTQSNRAPASIVYSQSFNNANVGIYTEKNLFSDFYGENNILFHERFYRGDSDNPGRASIVNYAGGDGKVLAVRFPNGGVGSKDGAQFQFLIPGGNHTELYLTYEVKFESGFRFKKGGKLPGLCGFNINYRNNYNERKCPSGEFGSAPGTGRQPDGFSARIMWRENGAGEAYVYHGQQPGQYGEQLSFGNFYFSPGKWHTIRQYVKLNDRFGDDANGIIKVWVNNEDAPRVNASHLELRQNYSVFINSLFFSTFFGGADSSWASEREQEVYFNNFIIEK